MQNSLIYKVLDLARWAPSGDNTQPWQFEILNQHEAIIHTKDTREHSIYDKEGRPSQIAIGTLLQTIELVATKYQHIANIEYLFDPTQNDLELKFKVSLIESSQIKESPLCQYIQSRSVNRRKLSITKLSLDEKNKLQQSVGEHFQIRWYESFSEKKNIALMLAKTTDLRLKMYETYLIHKEIIEWDSQFSQSKIPDQAIGLDSLTLKLMKWVLSSWNNVKFMNTYLMGTAIPQIQLDIIPAFNCGAHFALISHQQPKLISDFIEIGKALQRFWLTATSLNLQLQPELAPVIFQHYANDNHSHINQKYQQKLRAISTQLTDIINPLFIHNLAFIGRLGKGSVAQARSIRHPLDTLIIKK